MAELEQKTEAMLELIEHDADSFAQRAEMYYKKRPELISMVEDFYRTHRLLAAKYDQLKSESGSRLISTLGSPFSSTKHQPKKLTSKTEHNYETCSETSDLEDCALSEVDNPEEEEEEEEIQPENEKKIKETDMIEEMRKLREEVERLKKEKRVQTEEIRPKNEKKIEETDMIEEMRKLREEVERLKEEKRVQTEKLLQKDEEKMEVIRQLSFTVDLLKEENLRLRKNWIQMAREAPKKRKNNPFELSQLKSTFLGKLFNLSPAVIAL